MPRTAADDFALAPYSYEAARRIAGELDLVEPVAVALVRRGFETPAAAREFLDGDERHDAGEFAGIEAAVEAIQAAIGARDLITVHGDYDVDGVTATTILVAALRELGAECDWLIPGRAEDGYGLTAATVERLRERGTRLVVTADCGIGSAAEIEALERAGVETVVTDHHEPPARLPDCPIVHPRVSAYPYPHLCAAGVAHKIVAALAGEERANRDLDLVALATVADMVPLTGENRSLVRRGLERARRAERPGLRALMAAAAIVPERLDEQDLGFRLAPRINAAGRLYRADAGVELLLTEDPERAAQIAGDLDRANHERRDTEREVFAAAERHLREAGPAGIDAPALVAWGEGWHPGVVGICASRLAERYAKPAVVIALDEAGRGRGSGRSVPGLDLLGGLEACAESLRRFGGHRAAAGLEIDADDLERFRNGFSRHVGERLDPAAARPPEPIDAVVGGESLTHRVAEQFARLGPFGKGNPEVRLLVPAARIGDVRPMGAEGNHARFTLVSGGVRASGVAFGAGPDLPAAAPVHASLGLELNEWNGAVTPRVVLATPHPASRVACPGCECPPEEFADRVAAALAGNPAVGPPTIGAAREVVDAEGASGVAVVAGLASSGEPLLVVAADALWRRGLLESAAPPARFGGGRSALVAARGSIAAGLEEARSVLDGGGVALADWPALALAPELAPEFPHVALADPAPDPRSRAVAERVARGAGYLHLLASHADSGLAVRALALSIPDRAGLAAAWRSLRATADGGQLDLSAIRAALARADGAARSPEWCGAALRVLAEIGVVALHGTGRDVRLEVVSSVRGQLESSSSHVAQQKAREECVRFLTRYEKPTLRPVPAAA